MTYWVEGFAKVYPNVKIQVEGKGSSTAPPALIAGTSQLGPMSRRMKAEEIDAFEQKYGYKPRLIAVALDGLAVYVHKDNPVKSLLHAAGGFDFLEHEKARRQGREQVGRSGSDGRMGSRPVSLYGRNSASGTYGFFRKSCWTKEIINPP
jgi:phosphate transport system substrate-binding protein